MTKPCTIIFLTGLISVLGACQAKQDEPEQVSQAEPVLQAEISTPEMVKVTEPNTESQAEVAIEDLASRLGISGDEISVVRAESVTWRDGSLGCPRKGMSYTQALVPGTLLVLSAGGTEFEYHSRRNGQPFYCASPQPPLQNSGASDR